MTSVDQALSQLVGVLDELNAVYAVIGGIAVRTYGIPRPTYDVDFTLAMPRDRLDQVLRDYDELA